MMRVKTAPVLLLMGSLSLGPAATLTAHDELYYSAAACVPVNANHLHGSGAQGFEFTANGGWYNFDANSTQILVCPVPYRRNTNDLAPIVARVVVEDWHGLSFARAFLCGRGSTGSQSCVNRDNFPTVFGNSTIELSLTPTAATRFVWLEVHIPDNEDDGNPFTPNATSGLLGYRIFRN